MKIGLLSLYFKLYDDCCGDAGVQARKFIGTIASKLTERGFEVVVPDACRVRDEFVATLNSFVEQGCSAVATLHLAYSPSLEAADAIAACPLPVVVLDTTPDSYQFVDEDVLMRNHGIHGVQDMCNLLRRRGKDFLITAGDWNDGAFFDSASRQLKAAGMAWRMCHARVGAVGGEFPGMGDFLVPRGTFGMQVVDYTDQPEASEAELDAEEALDRERFIWDPCLTREDYRTTLRACMKLRRWAKVEKLDAYTICFCGITRQNGWATLPFLECAKAISNGMGYAGEGDVLTAVTSRCLADVFPRTSFTEMFCPDWVGNRIFTSHMGEMNLFLSPAKPLLKKMYYTLSDTGEPVIATANFPAGDAILVDLAPGPDGRFTLITAPVHYSLPVYDCVARNCGWFTPSGKLGDFLAEYSSLGGTHHLVVCYGGDLRIVQQWAKLMGWEYHNIGG